MEDSRHYKASLEDAMTTLKLSGVCCHLPRQDDEGMTTSLEAPSRRITRSMYRGESSIPSPLSLFCITLV